MLRTSKRAVALAAAVTASLGFGLLTAPAVQAADPTILVWADEKRGPVLKKYFDENADAAPGYKVEVKYFSGFDPLNAAFDSATKASGPDIIVSSGGVVGKHAKSGKLAPVTLSSSVRRSFPTSALERASYDGKIYGVPMDFDTTFMWFNTKYTKAQPKTITDMVKYYNANKTKQKFTGGICAMDGTWGSQAIITALGGGAWGFTGGKADPNKVLFNSAEFKKNIKSLLIDPKTKKSNGFFKWDGCKADFMAGKIPFATGGAWHLGDADKAKLKFGIGSVPGMKAGTFGQQWTGITGAFLTSFAKDHGVEAGAKLLLTNVFADTDLQVVVAAADSRPPAELDAAKKSNATARAIAAVGARGQAQLDALLGSNAGGSDWYGTLGDAYTKIFNQGANVDSTLDAAAVVLRKNFLAGAAGL